MDSTEGGERPPLPTNCRWLPWKLAIAILIAMPAAPRMVVVARTGHHGRSGHARCGCGNRLCDRLGRTGDLVAFDAAGSRPHHRALPMRGQDRQEGRSSRPPRRQGSAGHAERSARAGGVPAPRIRPPVATAGARGRDLAGLSARRERPGAHSGADRGPGPAAGILQTGGADGRHRPQGGRRSRRHGRPRHDPLPHRPGEAAMGRRRRQRGGHPPRPGRPEGVAAHRRVRQSGAAGHSSSRSRRPAIPSPRRSASGSACPTTRRCGSA